MLNEEVGECAFETYFRFKFDIQLCVRLGEIEKGKPKACAENLNFRGRISFSNFSKKFNRNMILVE